MRARRPTTLRMHRRTTSPSSHAREAKRRVSDRAQAGEDLWGDLQRALHQPSRLVALQLVQPIASITLLALIRRSWPRGQRLRRIHIGHGRARTEQGFELVLGRGGGGLGAASVLGSPPPPPPGRAPWAHGPLGGRDEDGGVRAAAEDHGLRQQRRGRLRPGRVADDLEGLRDAAPRLPRLPHSDLGLQLAGEAQEDQRDRSADGLQQRVRRTHGDRRAPVDGCQLVACGDAGSDRWTILVECRHDDPAVLREPQAEDILRELLPLLVPHQLPHRTRQPLPLEPLLLLAQSLLLYRRALRAIDQAGVETLGRPRRLRANGPPAVVG
mmetsp:Transcript_1210/g.3322  ORF Transcript_1210/g.3322 Transcript_1210/m.3322 type:complete len:326 (+) Transcript_1210:1-978(+)